MVFKDPFCFYNSSQRRNTSLSVHKAFDSQPVLWLVLHFCVVTCLRKWTLWAFLGASIEELDLMFTIFLWWIWVIKDCERATYAQWTSLLSLAQGFSLSSPKHLLECFSLPWSLWPVHVLYEDIIFFITKICETHFIIILNLTVLGIHPMGILDWKHWLQTWRFSYVRFSGLVFRSSEHSSYLF